MASRSLIHFAVFSLSATMLALPLQLAAQQHTRYQLIDLGTLGGPTSYFSVSGPGNKLLNDAGVVSGWADTSTPDPNFPNFCLNPDCFLAHAFRWKNGAITDLGALAGNNSSAGAINARGWVSGLSQNGATDPVTGGPVNHAVLWKGNEIIDLGTLGGYESLGVYLNNSGLVVGISSINAVPDPLSFLGASFHPFIWKNGVMVDLGTLGGLDAGPSAGCSNERDDLVAGGSFTNSTPNATTRLPTQDPFLWKNGTMLDLGTLGGTLGVAQCANNRGQVIGQSDLEGDLIAHPFLWDGGPLVDLGTLGGDNGFPFWITDANEVVGTADLPGNEVHHAFLWTDGVMKDLGSLGTNSQAFAINSNLQIVGRSRISDTTLHATLWDRDGSMLDLNNLIPADSSLELEEADNINDRGEILGIGAPPGIVPDPESIGLHLFLLVPCAVAGTNSCASEAIAGKVRNDPVPTDRAYKASPTHAVPIQAITAWHAQIAQRFHLPVAHRFKD